MSSSRALTARAGGSTVAGSSPVKKRSSTSRSTQQPPAAGELQVIQNPHHFSQNVGVVYFLRIYMTIVAGAAVGILGIEGWGGFTVYLLSQLLCTLPILAKCGGNYEKYLGTWDKVFLEHIFSSTAILSYILFWMIFYNVCHVF